MKVIYKSIEATIRKAIYDAERLNRTIDKIELSVIEANEVSEVMQRSVLFNGYVFNKKYTTEDIGKEIGKLYGVSLVVA